MITEYKVETSSVLDAERIMNDMAKYGWKVIAVTPNIFKGYGIIITFERNRESKIDKLNKKVDLLIDKLVDDPSFKENSDDKSNLTIEEKKRYKDQIQSICHQFPFYKCSSSIKDKASDLVIESNESINKAVTKEEA